MNPDSLKMTADEYIAVYLQDIQKKLRNPPYHCTI